MANTFIYSIKDHVDGSYLLDTQTCYGLTGQNTGNLAFHYAINKILGGDQQVLPWDAPVGDVNATGKIGVIPCANQLGPHADYSALGARFSELDIPLVAIGLGAQTDSQYKEIPQVPEGTLNWVRQIALRSPVGAPNIGVRGPFTLKVLAEYGLAESAIVTGCPTLFLSPEPKLGEKIRARAERKFDRIAVASGHQGWKHLAKLESTLCRLADRTGGTCIAQSPYEMVALGRGEAADLPEKELAACRDYCCPAMDLPDFVQWSRQYFRSFFNVSEWMECLRGHDFIIGTRIHGVMLGLQAGIPGLCLVHDSRTREMCETMMVPYVMAGQVINGVPLDSLRQLFVFDAEKFDENRRTLAKRLNEFLMSNDIADSQWLQAISG